MCPCECMHTHVCLHLPVQAEATRCQVPQSWNYKYLWDSQLGTQIPFLVMAPLGHLASPMIMPIVCTAPNWEPGRSSQSRKYKQIITQDQTTCSALTEPRQSTVHTLIWVDSCWKATQPRELLNIAQNKVCFNIPLFKMMGFGFFVVTFFWWPQQLKMSCMLI